MEIDDADAGTRRIHLASWDYRFWAWLIDVILVNAVLSVLGEVAGVFSILTGNLVALPFLGVNGLGLWIYWTALEGYQGQSAGKLVLDIVVTDERGDDVDYLTAAIESFGKAFLLPLDLLIGWIAMEDEYVRLFNAVTSTIVLRVPEDGDVPAGVEYVRPGE